METTNQKLMEAARFIFIAIVLIWLIWFVAESAINEIPNSIVVGIILFLVLGFAYFVKDKSKEIFK